MAGPSGSLPGLRRLTLGFTHALLPDDDDEDKNIDGEAKGIFSEGASAAENRSQSKKGNLEAT
jgi:hypothetical protein